MALAGTIVAATRRAREQMEDPVTYYAVLGRLGDPMVPGVTPGVVTKRQRQKAGRLTHAVWNALVYDPETGTAQVDTNVVPMTMRTGELPIVVKEDETEAPPTSTDTRKSDLL